MQRNCKSSAKFNHIMLSLQSEITAEVRDLFVNPLKDLRDLRFFSTEIQGFEDVTRFYGALMGSKNGFDGI